MVYKIRNKGFDIFGAATSPRVFNARKTKISLEMGRHVTIQTHITRYNQMRLFHNYRRISRAWKQFLMGDKLAEQMAILTLKSQITRPLNYNAPIENNWYMGRTWADIWDKHYSLFSTNQHPLQLESYQQYNDYTKGLHDKAHMGQISSIADRVKEV